MAKRFTDTNKYKKPFLRSLPGPYKLFWDYLLSECDHAGLWICDFEIAQIYLGRDMQIDKDLALKYFNDDEKTRVIEIENGKYWFISTFIEFQYGEKLSKTNNMYQSIEKILKKYDLFQYLDIEITEQGETISSFRNRISKKVKDKIILEDNLTCQYCQTQKTKEELIIDHIIPLKKGGNNDDSNLITSCVRCNSHKTDLDPDVFLLKNHSFLNPTNKLISLINSLKGGDKPLQGAKDMDMDKDKEMDKDKGGVGEKKEIAKKTDDRADANQAEENGKKTTFKNSPLFDRSKFDAELSDWPLEKRNYYYEAAITWSDDHQTKKDQSVNWARRLRGWDRMHPWNANKNGSASNGNHYPKTESQRIVNTVNHGAFLQGNDAVWCTIPGTFFSGNLTLNKEGNIEYWNAGKTVLTIYVKDGYKSNRVYKLKDGNTIQKVHEYLLKESQIKVA